MANGGAMFSVTSSSGHGPGLRRTNSPNSAAVACGKAKTFACAKPGARPAVVTRSPALNRSLALAGATSFTGRCACS